MVIWLILNGLIFKYYKVFVNKNNLKKEFSSLI